MFLIKKKLHGSCWPGPDHLDGWCRAGGRCGEHTSTPRRPLSRGVPPRNRGAPKSQTHREHMQCLLTHLQSVHISFWPKTARWRPQAPESRAPEKQGRCPYREKVLTRDPGLSPRPTRDTCHSWANPDRAAACARPRQRWTAGTAPFSAQKLPLVLPTLPWCRLLQEALPDVARPALAPAQCLRTPLCICMQLGAQRAEFTA